MFFKLKFLFLFILVYTLSFSDAHIFVYHRFNDERYNSSNILTSKLKKDFEYLKNNGYVVVKMEKIIEKIKNKEEIPDNWVALTIDDAYKTFYTNGLKVFKEFNYPFTLFVNTKAVNDGYGDYLNWKEIDEISKYGTIGSHSHSHPHSVRIGQEKLEKDLKTNLDIFKKKYSKEINFYTHPYGEYTNETIKIVKKFGFSAIFNQTVGAVNYKTNINDINRIAIGNDDNISYWLKIKFLDADWLNIDTSNGTLNKIKVKVSPEINQLEVFISGYGWKWYKVKKGILESVLNKKLKYNVNRVFIKTEKNEWSSYTIINK